MHNSGVISLPSDARCGTTGIVYHQLPGHQLLLFLLKPDVKVTVHHQLPGHQLPGHQLPGFSKATDLDLLEAVSQQTPKHHFKYVGIVLDEMHVKEGLYFDKHSGTLVGYSDLGAVFS